MKDDPLKIYIGYDRREAKAMAVADFSLRRRASVPVSITHLKADKLAEHGLFRRPVDRRGNIYDIHSNAYCSTDFSNSRFIVPLLAHSGFALFIDCDVVVYDDIAKLFALTDPQYAVMVVPHNQNDSGTKMDGQIQYQYKMKNASSCMIFNVDHPANKRLSLQDINERPGRDLHGFYWLNSDEIGYLPARWNWLVGIEDKMEDPALIHYTLGTPDISTDCEHSEIWLKEYREMCNEH